MPLNKSKGNMYGFVTHTWNTVKGKCPHDCSYCYMKRFPQKELHFDKKELRTDLGSGNIIFVGSSCDMWADDVKTEWIYDTIKHCLQYDNTYLFQTKNPLMFTHQDIYNCFPEKTILCTTIETNRIYAQMNCGNNDIPQMRSLRFKAIHRNVRKMITVEPIMDFDLYEMIELIKRNRPEQVNIGADSGYNNLPEPSALKVHLLISELSKFTKVHQKDNLRRLL